MNVCIADIDQIVNYEKIRPSILLPVYEVVGTGLGIMSRLSPAPSASKFLAEIVENASSMQLNDSIRSISLDSPNDYYDVKETLKFHRDLSSSSGYSAATADETAAKKTSTHTSAASIEGVITTAVHTFLKISEKI